MTLHLAPCSAKAARYACENWHYSASVPMPKNRYIGVWEGGAFIGAVIFSHGANHQMGSPFGLAIGEIAELTRVALTSHKAHVTRIIRVALLLLRSANPDLHIIISYADPAQGHEGTIYKAGNWHALGKSQPSYGYAIGGKVLHKRAFTGKNYGNDKSHLPASAVQVQCPGKFRFGYPLTARGAAILSRRRPDGRSEVHSVAGGETPTTPLHSTDDAGPGALRG